MHVKNDSSFMVQGKSLLVRRGKKSIFRELSFSLAAGNHLTIVGPNGSGKSTLLELIAGRICFEAQPNSSLLWNFTGAVESSRLSAKEYVRICSPSRQESYAKQEREVLAEEVLHAGFGQDDFLYFELNAEQKEYAQSLVELASFQHCLQYALQMLSQGQLRLLLLLQALVSKPPLLLLDEPFDGLDLKSRATMKALLDEASKNGTSIISAVHRKADILPSSRYLLFLSAEGENRSLISSSAYKPFVASSLSSIESPPFFASKSHQMLLFERREGHLPVIEEAIPHRVKIASPILPLPDTRPLCERFYRFWQEDKELGDPSFVGNIHSYDQAHTCLEVKNANVFLERKHILHDVHWKVQDKEQWIICGGNGAGKSTLLRFLYGDIQPAFGTEVEWCSSSRPPLPFFRQHVGYVSDRLQFEYVYDLEAVDIVLSGLYGSIGLYQAVSKEDTDRAEEILRIFGLEKEMNNFFHSLSTGQARRVLLARALMSSPALLLLDEPCSGLDEENRYLYLDILAMLAKSGITMFYVSHYESDIPDFFTHKLVLSEGRTVFSGLRSLDN